MEVVRVRYKMDVLASKDACVCVPFCWSVICYTSLLSLFLFWPLSLVLSLIIGVVVEETMGMDKEICVALWGLKSKHSEHLREAAVDICNHHCMYILYIRYRILHSISHAESHQSELQVQVTALYTALRHV